MLMIFFFFLDKDLALIIMEEKMEKVRLKAEGSEPRKK